MAPPQAAAALPLLYAICAFNTSNYRSYGFLAPCSIDASTGRVAKAGAPAVFVGSDSSLCNIAFRAAPRPRFYVPSMPGGEWTYQVHILDAETGAEAGAPVTTKPGIMYTYFAHDALNGELYAYGDLENGTNVGIAQVQATEPSSSGDWTLLDYGVPGWVGAGSFDCSGGFSTLHEPGSLGVFYASYIGKEASAGERHGERGGDVEEQKVEEEEEEEEVGAPERARARSRGWGSSPRTPSPPHGLSCDRTKTNLAPRLPSGPFARRQAERETGTAR